MGSEGRCGGLSGLVRFDVDVPRFPSPFGLPKSQRFAPFALLSADSLKVPRHTLNRYFSPAWEGRGLSSLPTLGAKTEERGHKSRLNPRGARGRELCRGLCLTGRTRTRKIAARRYHAQKPVHHAGNSFGGRLLVLIRTTSSYFRFAWGAADLRGNSPFDFSCWK